MTALTMDAPMPIAQRAFRIVIGTFLLLAGGAFLAINAYILASGAAKFGYSEYDKMAYAAAAAIVPWVIAVLPMIVSQTWKPIPGITRWTGLKMPTLGTAAIVLVWGLFIAYNLTNGSGSIASARSEVVASRTHENTTLEADKSRRKAYADELSGIPVGRPAEAVAALIAGEKAKRTWDNTDQCRDPRGKASRAFCTNIEALKAEEANARRRVVLQDGITTLDAKIESTGATVGGTADPQVAMMQELACATIGCTDEMKLRLWLASSTPIVLEAGAAMLWYFAGLVFGFNVHRKVQAIPPPLTPEPLPVMTEPGKPILVSKERMVGGERESLSQTDLEDRRNLAHNFFSQFLLLTPGGAMPEREWYEQYESFCRHLNGKALPLESFRRVAARYVPGMGLSDVEGKRQYVYFGALPVLPKELKVI